MQMAVYSVQIRSPTDLTSSICIADLPPRMGKLPICIANLRLLLKWFGSGDDSRLPCWLGLATLLS